MTFLEEEGDDAYVERRPEDEYEDVGQEDDEEEDVDNQNPLASLLRLAKSSDFHDGEMVIRSLHETLQYVIDSPKDIKSVLDVMTSLSTSNEPVLRTDLMEQVPQIAFLCHDHPDKLGGLVTGNLVPMVVKFLTDPNDLVRKTSQAALLVLLEQELVSHNDVHDQVCPVILDLTEPDAIDYYKTEAVALMSKMAPLVGREMTERLFMQRFTRLCSDTLFQVRKVCAANFGEFSGVVGTSGTESVLLPYFLNLCEDGVWGVRKACADVFMVVSCACSLETRKKRLSPLFVPLLSDDNRWVRLAAFQNLGPFISTFADPNVTGLHYNDERVLYIGPSPKDSVTPPLDADSIMNPENSQKKSEGESTDDTNEWSDLCLKNSVQIENSSLERKGSKSDDFSVRMPPTTDDTSSSRGKDFRIKIEEIINKFSLNDNTTNLASYTEVNETNENDGSRFRTVPLSNPDSNVNSSCNSFESSLEESSSGNDIVRKLGFDSSNDDPNFNEFNYWRIPLPELDLDLGVIESLQLQTERCDLPQEPVETSTDVVLEESEVIRDKVPPLNAPADDVQAELEALAASLAESIFYNESNPEMKGHERSQTGPKEERVGSNASFSLRFSHSDDPSFGQEEKDLQTPESGECTLVSLNDDDLADDAFPSTKEFESKTDSQVEGDSTVSCTQDTPSEQLQSQFTGESCGSILGKYDYSKSLHNLTSFSNLSALSTGSRSKDSDATNKEIYSIWSPEKPRSYRDTQKSSMININVNQDIVPKTLLEHYISMTDPVRAETVDEEITRHCAYSLPAVALTLGRSYWSLLRETYKTLATDMHWKVRRTLAFSIHELALILGEELAQKDLLPVFEGFIKDLDEVRIGVLKHLAHFLKMLPQPQRKLFLPRLNEFLSPDNVNNWRFRLELALQLAQISELFTPQECWTHICPITFALMMDKVVEIRRTCFGVVSQLARKLMAENEDSYILPLSQQLIQQFAQAETWKKRQSYVYVVGQIIKDASLPLPVVCAFFLPTFLELSQDKVPNIRLVIARIINSSIMTLDYFHNPEIEAASKVRETFMILQNDRDKDVQYFASYAVDTEIIETQDPNFY